MILRPGSGPGVLLVNPQNAESGIPKHGCETETAAARVWRFLFWLRLQCLVATRRVHTSSPSCFLVRRYISIDQIYLSQIAVTIAWSDNLVTRGLSV